MVLSICSLTNTNNSTDTKLASLEAIDYHNNPYHDVLSHMNMLVIIMEEVGITIIFGGVIVALANQFTTMLYFIVSSIS